MLSKKSTLQVQNETSQYIGVCEALKGPTPSSNAPDGKAHSHDADQNDTKAVNVAETSERRAPKPCRRETKPRGGGEEGGGPADRGCGPGRPR